MIKYLALDTETTGVDLHRKSRAFAVSMADEDGRTFYYSAPVNPKTREVVWPKSTLKEIARVISLYDVPVFHNAKFDIRALEHMGLGLLEKYFRRGIYEDVLLASHCLLSDYDHGLKSLAYMVLDISPADEEALKEAVRAARRAAGPEVTLGASVEEDYWLPSYLDPKNQFCKQYAIMDAQRTIALWVFFQEALKSEGLLKPYSREKALAPYIYQLESDGTTIHPDRVREQEAAFSKVSEKALRRCLRVASAKGTKDLNINSGAQVGAFLFKPRREQGQSVVRPNPNGFNLPCTEYTAGGDKTPPVPATDADSLKAAIRTIESLQATRTRPTNLPELDSAKAFIESLLEYKKFNTLIKYLANYHEYYNQDDGRYYRIHCGYNQTGTRTTRLSSSGPNLQNVGKGKEDEETHEVKNSLRVVFGPRAGRVWYPIDYQQLQLRIFAFASEEQSMIDAFEQGWDFHTFVATRVFRTDNPTKNERRKAKNINFGLIFGAGPAKVDLYGGPGTYDTYRGQFPSLDRYMRSMIDQAKKIGHITTAGGYRIRVPRDKPYVAVNFYVQGTEGDLVKNAMISCCSYLATLPYRAFLTLNVHDELVFDLPARCPIKVVKELKNRMEGAGRDLGMVTPVSIEKCVRDWAHGEKICL